jgi:hypothetical protein
MEINLEKIRKELSRIYDRVDLWDEETCTWRYNYILNNFESIDKYINRQGYDPGIDAKDVP